MRHPPLASLFIGLALACLAPAAWPSDATAAAPGPSDATAAAPGPSDATAAAPGPSDATAAAPGPSDVDAKTSGKAAAPAPGGAVRSVFFVAKSENRNQVHYGIALDADCAPEGPAPVFAYWRMRERGPLATEPLLRRELPAYGIASQHVVDRTDRGGRVVLTLSAVPRRAIAIDADLQAGACRAVARATIAGVASSLESVFVQLRWPFGVDYLMLSGSSDIDGHRVEERMH